jgi:hypothetical protein
MFKAEYDKLIRENFDLSDRMTRQYIATLEDAKQDQLLTSLSSALYDKITTRVEDIDFGTIPASRGDITKVEGFNTTQDCLNIIRRLVIEYKQNTSIVDVVLSAIQNIKDRKGIFTKAYALNVELPMLVYNTMVMSVEGATSLMISTCIQYIKDPTSNTFKTALDKVVYTKTLDNMLFKQLINFNNICANGSLDKIMEDVIKHPVKEDVDFTEEEPADGDNRSGLVDNPVPESPFDDNIETSEEEPREKLPYEDIEDDIEAADTEIVDRLDDTNDSVEAKNIPTVDPTDSVSPEDRPINEYDKKVNEAAPLVAIPIVLAGIKVIPAMFNLIIKLLREAVYVIYYSRLKFSDYLSIQANFIEANANELQYSTTSKLSDADKKKTIKKQLKWVERLRKWSNKFAIDNKQAVNKANNDIDDDNSHKHTIKDDGYGEYSIW